VRVFAKRTLKEFWIDHPDSEQQLKSWYDQALKGDWPTPNYIVSEFPNARQIGKDRVIFNIKGNFYRLIVRINYKYGMVYIRFIGTHGEYDKIDPLNI
jgi:mRNA interferase HigB